MAIIAAVVALTPKIRKPAMSILLLEALGAMVLLIFIVWWTMFSGRKNGEIKNDAGAGKQDPPDKP